MGYDDVLTNFCFGKVCVLSACRRLNRFSDDSLTDRIRVGVDLDWHDR